MLKNCINRSLWIFIPTYGSIIFCSQLIIHTFIIVRILSSNYPVAKLAFVRLVKLVAPVELVRLVCRKSPLLKFQLEISVDSFNPRLNFWIKLRVFSSLEKFYLFFIWLENPLALSAERLPPMLRWWLSNFRKPHHTGSTEIRRKRCCRWKSLLNLTVLLGRLGWGYCLDDRLSVFQIKGPRLLNCFFH